MLGIEQEDFAEVVRHHRLSIFCFVLASVRDTDIAENLTQDCFWKAYQGWHRFRGDSSVKTWLRQIALNVIRNSIRSNGLQFWRTVSAIDAGTDASIIDTSPSPETQVIQREALRAVWKAAEALSPKQQIALRLRFAQDMDLFEIAAAMDITEGAVKVHLFRAIRSIRVALRGSACA